MRGCDTQQAGLAELWDTSPDDVENTLFQNLKNLSGHE